MKLKITHLKAPWPQGAVIGDVLELDQVPGWALGKCERVADDAEVTVSLAPVKFVANVPLAEGNGHAGREALETEAKALGVSFNARTSDETLAARIAEAKQ